MLLDNYIAASAQMAATKRLAAPDARLSQVTHDAQHDRDFKMHTTISMKGETRHSHCSAP